MESKAISLIKQWLESLYHKDIPLIALRYKPFDEKYAYSGDYDYIANEKDLSNIIQELFFLASSRNLSFDINKKKYGKTIITLYDDIGTVTVEIWSFLDLKPLFSSIRYIFWEDLESVIIKKEDHYAFNIEFEILFYIVHLYAKKKNITDPLVQERLEHYYNLAYNEVLKEYIKNILSSKSVSLELLENIYKTLIQKKILFLSNDKKIKERLLNLKKEKLKRKVAYIIAKMQGIIAVEGPDGVGKSSIVTGVLKRITKKKATLFRFKKLFRHSILYKILRSINAKIAKKMEKNQFDDKFAQKLFYIALVRYPFLVLYRLMIRKVYFSDRYFYDLFFKDTRFLDKESYLLPDWKSLLKITPKPLWLLHLDAPNEVIFTRKKELTDQSVDLYRKSFFEIYLEHDLLFYSYINTANPLEKTTTFVSEKFLERS